MGKSITKIGNSQGIIFDRTVLELAHLKAGNEVNVEATRGHHKPERSAPAPDSPTWEALTVGVAAGAFYRAQTTARSWPLVAPRCRDA
jgi:antitoxin component of MazEF toxin-antitoxin module